MRLLLSLMLAAVVLSAGYVLAQESPAQPAKPPAEPAPAPVEVETAERPAIPVAVLHQGEDPQGIQLAFALKEVFSRSPLFRLAEAESKRVVVRIASRAEFPGRPELASCYGVTWVFAEKSDVLALFLEDAAGVVTHGQTQNEAAALAARTDGVADRFGYLFE
ncbi:MAG: hypothetical protein F6K39_01920 [Okeania sp. SIO3B3]|nr:hypothetical protein [Okeania sp. SIO3B3]